MPNNNSFFLQKLNRVNLLPLYIAETISPKIVDLNDNQGNPVVIYQSDYQKLRKYLEGLKEPEKIKIGDFSKLPIARKLELLETAQIKLIRYYNMDNLQKYKLDAKKTNFSTEGNIVACGGTMLSKSEHQNCVVMSNNEIFIHPKSRSELGHVIDQISGTEGMILPKTNRGLIGVNHSSLSNGKEVQFAGSFVHNKTHGWLLDNRTGHYGTHAYQLRLFLQQLANQEIDLSTLTVKTCIAKTGKISPTDTDQNYHILYENAAEMLDRMNHSLSSIDNKLR